MTRALAAAASIALAACANHMPDHAREPTGEEWATLDDVRLRWEERIAPLSPKCARFLASYRILDATRRDKLKWCWRDEPGQCAADASLSRWGCCAACAVIIDGHPVSVLSELLTPAEHDSGLRHEAVHHLGHCSKRWSHLSHRDPLLWGANGVHPL